MMQQIVPRVHLDIILLDKNLVEEISWNIYVV